MPEFDVESIDVSDPKVFRVKLGEYAQKNFLQILTNPEQDGLELSSGEKMLPSADEDGSVIFRKKSGTDFTSEEIAMMIEKTSFIYRMPENWTERVLRSLEKSKHFERAA